MPIATIQSRCRHHGPLHAHPEENRRARGSTTLVPEAKVQDMLLEIAFVLHATRRISNEIREAKADAE